MSNADGTAVVVSTFTINVVDPVQDSDSDCDEDQRVTPEELASMQALFKKSVRYSSESQNMVRVNNISLEWSYNKEMFVLSVATPSGEQKFEFTMKAINMVIQYLTMVVQASSEKQNHVKCSVKRFQILPSVFMSVRDGDTTEKISVHIEREDGRTIELNLVEAKALVNVKGRVERIFHNVSHKKWTERAAPSVIGSSVHPVSTSPRKTTAARILLGESSRIPVISPVQMVAESCAEIPSGILYL